MGIKCGHSINYTITNLRLNDIITITKFRLFERRSFSLNNDELSSFPVVDIDASWVIRRIGNTSVAFRVTYLLQLCCLLIKNGCCVKIVCDGDRRHHSKRSTTKREVDCYRNRVDYHFLKCKLSCLPIDNITTDDGIEDLEIKELKKKVKRLEKKVSETVVDVGNILYHEIKNRINKMLVEGEVNNNQLTIMQAEFQADMVIAYRTVKHLNHIVFSSDSDQGIHCGSECICIKEFDFKHEKKQTTLEKIGLFCTNERTMHIICDTINLPYDNFKVKQPKYNILDNVNDLPV